MARREACLCQLAARLAIPQLAARLAFVSSPRGLRSFSSPRGLRFLSSARRIPCLGISLMGSPLAVIALRQTASAAAITAMVRRGGLEGRAVAITTMVSRSISSWSTTRWKIQLGAE